MAPLYIDRGADYAKLPTRHHLREIGPNYPICCIIHISILHPDILSFFSHIIVNKKALITTWR